MDVVGCAGTAIRELAVPRLQRALRLSARRKPLDGTGRVAILLAQRCVPVTSIELSGPMIEQLRTKANQTAIPDCRRHGDLGPWPRRDWILLHDRRRGACVRCVGAARVALSQRPGSAASPGADEREAAAQEVRIVEPGLEPGFLRGVITPEEINGPAMAAMLSR